MLDLKSVNAFALSTYVLSIVAWVVAFAGSIAAKSSLGSYFPRFSWWALVFQLLLLILMPVLVFTNSLHFHRSFVICMLGVAFVYNSNSANNLVYYSYSSSAAASAGFIITCILNFLWLLYIGSDPDSPVVNFLDLVGSNENLLDRSARLGGGAAVASRARTSTRNRAESAAAANVSGNRDSRVSSNSYTVRGNDTMSKENNPFETSHPYSQELSGFENAKSDTATEHKRTSTTSANLEKDNRYSVVPDADYPVLVRGIYDYKASPDDINELSFSKGDVFKVKDTSGNWWQGKNSKGQIGMCPSNYLEVI